jgi:hypothetical protein
MEYFYYSSIISVRLIFACMQVIILYIKLIKLNHVILLNILTFILLVDVLFSYEVMFNAVVYKGCMCIRY